MAEGLGLSERLQRNGQVRSLFVAQWCGAPVLQVSRRFFLFIQRVFADSGYAGEKVAKATLIVLAGTRSDSLCLV